MPLNRADFPEMSDELWANIEAEADRRATAATQTAKRGLLTPDEAQAQVNAALEAERARLEADERGKLEIDRKALEAEQAKLAADRKSLKATKKLTAAGVPEDKIEALLPLVVGVADEVLDTTLDTLIATVKDTVKVQVDTTKQELLTNGTPPASSTTAPTDKQTAAATLAATDQVGAAQLLLEDAGLV